MTLFKSRSIKHCSTNWGQTEYNMLKIPTGGRQTSWLFTKRGLGFENRTTVKQIQVVRAGLEPGASGLHVRRPFFKGDIQGFLGLQMLQHAVYFRSLFSKTTHPDWSESYTIFQVSKSFLHVINAWSPPTHVCSSLTLVRSKLQQEGRGLLGIIAYVYDVAVNGLPQGAGLCKWVLFDSMTKIGKSSTQFGWNPPPCLWQITSCVAERKNVCVCSNVS